MGEVSECIGEGSCFVPVWRYSFIVTLRCWQRGAERHCIPFAQAVSDGETGPGLRTSSYADGRLRHSVIARRHEKKVVGGGQRTRPTNNQLL